MQLRFNQKPIEMDKFELQARTMKFHVDVIKLCSLFPKMQPVLKQQNSSSDPQDRLEQITERLTGANQKLISFIK
jgi:hypothetical protein